MNVNFYTTVGCHLCEQALQVIAQVQASSHLMLRVTQIDIAADDLLVERYGIRIPVVQVPGSDIDLGWPFDEKALITFLEAHS